MNKLQNTLKRFEESLDAEMIHLDESIASTKKELRESISDFMTFEEGKETYKAFFAGKLKKFGVKSPMALDDADKKKFFAEIEKEWTGEKNESMIEAAMAEVIEPRFISDEEGEEEIHASDDKDASPEIEDEDDEVVEKKEPKTDEDKPVVDDSEDDNDEESKKAKQDDQTDVDTKEVK